MMYCNLDDLIPFCEFFTIPYFLWFGYVAVIYVFLMFADREEFVRLMADKAYLEQVMAKGAEDAYRNARRTMSKVRRKLGFTELKH